MINYDFDLKIQLGQQQFIMPRQNNPFLLSQSIKQQQNQHAKAPNINPQPSLDLQIQKQEKLHHQNQLHLTQNHEQINDHFHNPKFKVNKIVEWTLKEEKILFELHNKLGNKWSKLSQYFPERSDNCVKNHFYSRFRMSFRHLNKYLQKSQKLKKKTAKIHILYKIMSICQQRFNQSTQYTSCFIQFANDLKNKIINFLYYNQEDILSKESPQSNIREHFNERDIYNENQIIQMVNDINKFNHRYKARKDILKEPKHKKTYKKKDQIDNLDHIEDQIKGSSVNLFEFKEIQIKSCQNLNSLLCDQPFELFKQNSFKDLKIIQQDQYLFDESLNNIFQSPIYLWDKFL